MNKTDKELAVEFAQSYVQAWFTNLNRAPLDGKAIQALIQNAYQTIHNLKD